MNHISKPKLVILPNRSRLAFQQIKGSSVVAFQAWVFTGSSYEDKDTQAGIAHVIEHMLFKGSRNFKMGEMAANIERSGGSVNAWTSFDETVYHAVVPLSEWKKAADVITDAVSHPLFDSGELEKEKKVILEEIRHGENSPYHRVSDKLFEIAYSGHPYAYPIIGTAESVSSFTRDDLLRFFNTWYQPQNITYIVTGDLNIDEVRDYLSSILDVTSGSELPSPPQVPFIPGDFRTFVEYGPFNEAYLTLAVPFVDKYSLRTAVPDDLLSTVLGDGESSRLVKQLKYEKKLVLDTYSYAFTPKDSGLLIIGAVLSPDKLSEVVKAISIELASLSELSSSELNKARKIIVSDDINQLQTAQGIAKKIGFYLQTMNDIEGSSKYLSSINAADISSLKSRLDFLRKQPVYLSVMLPENYKTDENKLLELLKTSFGVKTPQKAPDIISSGKKYDFKRFTLSNGARLVVLEDHSLPVVSIRAGWKGGLLTEKPSISGISPVLSSLLIRGTAVRKADNLHNAIEVRGGTLIDFSGRNSIGLRLDTLTEQWEENFEYFMETLKFPAFDSQEFEIIKNHAIESLKTEQDQHGTRLLRLFEKLLYGKKHPYGLNSSGTESSLKKLTLNKIKSHFRKFYSFDNLVITAVGDVDALKMKELAEVWLADIPSSSNQINLPLEFSFELNRKNAFQKRDISQNYVICGVPGVSLYNDDRFVLEVIAKILSGQSGRLFMDLRDDKSLAYSVRGFSLEGLAPGYFASYIVTSPEKTEKAIDGLLYHYDKLRKEKVEKKEFYETLSYMKGIHDISLQYKSAICASVFFGELYNIGFDSFLRYKAKLDEVSPDKIMETAQYYLNEDKIITAVYGSRKPKIR